MLQPLRYELAYSSIITVSLMGLWHETPVDVQLADVTEPLMGTY